MNSENNAPETVVPAPEVSAAPAEKKPRKPRQSKKLTKHFFNASPRAQISSLWRAWLKKDTQKIEDFKGLIASGAAKIVGPLTKSDLKKLGEMGIATPEGLEIKARKPRTKKVKAEAPVNPEVPVTPPPSENSAV